MGGCAMILELGRSPRGFTAARLTLPSGTEFEQPNHWGGTPMPIVSVNPGARADPGEGAVSTWKTGVRNGDVGKGVCHVGV